MKQFFQNIWTKISTSLQSYPSWTVEAGVGILVGLIVGFLTRTLGRYFVIALVTLGVVGFVLHYMGVITIHTMPLMRAMGVNRIPPVGDLVGSVANWIQEHLVATVALIIGFIIGWKYGA